MLAVSSADQFFGYILRDECPGLFERRDIDKAHARCIQIAGNVHPFEYLIDLVIGNNDINNFLFNLHGQPEQAKTLANTAATGIENSCAVGPGVLCRGDDSIRKAALDYARY